jgi:Flp pilus assembly protein TadG
LAGAARARLLVRGSTGRFAAGLLRLEDGGPLVEFALVIPMMLALFTGIFAFASAFNNQQTLTQAVGSGGQYLQEIRATTSDPCQDTYTAIKQAAPFLNPNNITLTFKLNGTNYGPYTGSANSCTAGTADLGPGDQVTITATYPCKLPIFNSSFGSSCNIGAQVTEYEY